jgi:hypothetical protein
VTHPFVYVMVTNLLVRNCLCGLPHIILGFFSFIRGSSRNLHMYLCCFTWFLENGLLWILWWPNCRSGLGFVEQLLWFGGHCRHLILFKIKQVHFSYFMLKPWVQNPTFAFDYRNGTISGSLLFIYVIGQSNLVNIPNNWK